MSIDSASPRTRRAILAGALGAAVATVASALGRPHPVAAHDPDDVLLGGANYTATTTAIVNTEPSASINAFEVQVASPAGVGLMSLASASTGTTTAVSGTAMSDGGTAVYGLAASATGSTKGVSGVAGSADGTGVFGYAMSATGATVGVAGQAGSVAGTGVRGRADAVSGLTNGVLGEAWSTTDYSAAVHGISHATTGYQFGVYGQNTSDIGSAVSGYASSETGYTIGTEGNAASPAGAGTWGWNWAGGTGAMGIVGATYPAVAPNAAVFGIATDPAGSTVGVRGRAASPNGTGVIGVSGTDDPAPAAKTGVYGRATQDAAARGVYGYSTTGRGVYGQATTGVGVYGVASGAGGYALKTSGRISFAKVSGVATLVAGTTTTAAIPTGTDVTSASYVLLTPQGDPGTRRIWATLSVTNDTITIRASASAATNLRVAWLVVN